MQTQIAYNGLIAMEPRKRVLLIDAADLTKEYKNVSKAPFMRECIKPLAVEYYKRIHLSINNSIQVIGEITICITRVIVHANTGIWILIERLLFLVPGFTAIILLGV